MGVSLSSDYDYCGFRLGVRSTWTIAEWFANLFFILQLEDLSDGKYTNQLRESDDNLLFILYIILFTMKSIFWIYTFYHVIYNKGYFQVRVRVIQLWLLSISSTIVACIMIKVDKIHSKPELFLIMVMHIAPIIKKCFVLASFPFNIYFQYLLSILFATDLILMFPSKNVLEYQPNIRALEYFKFAIFIACLLFIGLISFRPISLLFEGKYPKFVKPVYRDYYDSEDGGWRAEFSQHEETAISNIKSQLLRVPVANTLRDNDLYGMFCNNICTNMFIFAILRLL